MGPPPFFDPFFTCDILVSRRRSGCADAIRHYSHSSPPLASYRRPSLPHLILAADASKPRDIAGGAPTLRESAATAVVMSWVLSCSNSSSVI